MNNSADRSRRGFLPYAKWLEPEIFSFQQSAYPDRLPEQIPDRWTWTFLGSAAQAGTLPMVWIYRKNDTIVAHQGAIAVRVMLGANEQTSGWFVETMAADEVRGKAIGPMLVKKALEELPFNLSMGQTAQMRELQFALGWQAVGCVPEFVSVVGGKFDLAGRLPEPLARIGATLLTQWHGWMRRRAKAKVKRDLYEFSRLTALGGEHDELWRRMRASLTFSVIRDSNYLQWKYLARPHSDLQLFELRSNGVVQGMAVLKLRPPSSAYSYTRGFITDVVADLSDQDALTTLVCSSVEQCRKDGAQSVVCCASEPRLRAVLKQCGFLEREPRYHFLLAAPADDPRYESSKLLVLDNWFLTIGDSDADEYVS